MWLNSAFLQTLDLYAQDSIAGVEGSSQSNFQNLAFLSPNVRESSLPRSFHVIAQLEVVF